MKEFAFGLGYSARWYASSRRQFALSGTTRSPAAAVELRKSGVEAYAFDGRLIEPGLRERLRSAEVVVISIPPDANGDPTLRAFARDLAESRSLRTVVYLSSIAVYGDANGGWVDETTQTSATSQRGRQRVEAEEAWRSLAANNSWRLHVLRLAGIYGPGRGVIEKLLSGEARRIVKPGQVFNRIHVDDIAQMIDLVVASALPGQNWNVSDDEPAPPQEVLAYAAGLVGRPIPAEEDFFTAPLSPMARSFYADNKRVANLKAKTLLGFAPRYPTYREGLAELAKHAVA